MIIKDGVDFESLDDEPLGFSLGEEIDCLEENFKSGRTTGG